VRDALKNYLALANGLTEVGRQRALAASKALVAQGEATVEQVSSLAEDLVQTSRSNRDTITALVRNEVDRALSRVGLATADEVRRLTTRLQSLEASLRAGARPAPAAGKKPAAKKVAQKVAKPAKRVAKPAKKAAAKPAPKPAAPRAAAKKPAPRRAAKPAKKSGS
jgi:polyhydroxyalkanoate synthesis regulator phasin